MVRQETLLLFIIAIIGCIGLFCFLQPKENTSAQQELVVESIDLAYVDHDYDADSDYLASY